MAVVIKSIQFLEFSIGGYPDGNVYFSLAEDHFLFYKHPFGIVIDPAAATEILTAEQHGLLVNTLNEIQVLNWEESYVNDDMLDGTQWDLELRYNDNKRTKTFSGSNAFPILNKSNEPTAVSSSHTYSKDFSKLLSALNTIVGKKNYFY